MKNISDRTAFSLIGVFSFSIVSFLIWLIYLNDYHGEIPEWTFNLSGYNAIFNSLSALCLISGYVAIRNKKVKVHLSFMGMAVLFSTGFLISYIMYHHFHGDTKFLGEGWVRILYFFEQIKKICRPRNPTPFFINKRAFDYLKFPLTNVRHCIC